MAGRVSGVEAAINTEIMGSLSPAQRLVVRKAMYQSLRAMWIVVSKYFTYNHNVQMPDLLYSSSTSPLLDLD